MRTHKYSLQLYAIIVVVQSATAQTPPKPMIELTQNQKVELRINRQQKLQVKAQIAPVAFTQEKWHRNWKTLAQLKAAKKLKEYPGTVMSAFLPDGPVSVGESWQVKQSAELLLKQLHEGATMSLHINDDAKGGWAILRAVSKNWAEIAFRVHGQFVLEDGWFTPSQFKGTLVVDRNTGDVVYFHLFVPQYLLNFDVGRKMKVQLPGEGAREMVVSDTGFCPRIELTIGSATTTKEIKWTEVLDAEKASRRLAIRFYPAWRINWLALEKALVAAKRLKKPIHVVAAAGPFKDEAC